MPAQLTADGLGIACVFSDGRRRAFTVADVAPAPLAADLLVGLAGLVHPHGSVDAPATVGGYLTGLKNLAAFAHARGLAGGAAALTRALLAEYWLQAGWLAELTTRRMLTSYDTTTGTLAGPVRELAGGRLFNAAPPSTPLVPYPAEDWERLHQACRTAVDEAFAGHRTVQVAAGRGGDPRELGWSQDNLAWLLAGRGPATATDVAAYLGRTNRWVELRGGVRPVCQALYPDVHTVIAYRLLLGVYTGIVPDGVADLGLADLDWAGDATVLLGYVKGRRAAESLTLPAKAVRLLEQWLAHSAPARAYAPADLRGHLWLHYNYYAARTGGRQQWWTARVPAATQRAWAASRGLTVDRRRVRTTYLSLRDRRSWQGSSRALVDPNHSPAVEGDSYLTAATPAQRAAVEAVVAEAQHDMLRRARPPVVLADAEVAAVVAGFPRLAATVGDDAAVAALVGGEQDVFAAACTDPTAGLHGPPGKPCPARPWVCLLCPLAVFTPRHAVNLLRLKAFFARQWQAVPSAQFMAVFGPYATRVDEVLARYPTTVLATASASVADRDDELPLRPEERTA